MKREVLVLIVVLVAVGAVMLFGDGKRVDFSVSESVNDDTNNCKALHQRCIFTIECCPGLSCVKEDNEPLKVCKKKDGQECSSHLECGPQSACCKYFPDQKLVCAPYPNIDPDYACNPIIDDGFLEDEQRAKLDNLDNSNYLPNENA
jgi:hypothetical protein